MSARSLRAIHAAIRDDIGDLVTRRPLPNATLQHLDPFLFLNHHGPQLYPPHNGGLPFGPHPHRGFETVTFILEGQLAHRDSGGHESVIDAGGVQWMTAGRGLVHEELSPKAFLEHGGPLEILQLWVNLPSSLKMTQPRYVGLQSVEMPIIKLGSASSLVPVSGNWMGAQGPIEPLTDVHLATVQLEPDASLSLPISRSRTIFLYVVRGEISVSGQHVPEFNLVEMNDNGDILDLSAEADSVLLIGHATPLREPIVAHGPFVMNTREEIMQAIRDYQSGKFG